MATVVFHVNGASKSVETDSTRSLLEVLREDLGVTGPKYGCGEGTCRSCVVLVDDRPVSACQIPVEKAAGKRIVTIEGLGDGETLHPVQQAFIDEGAVQCGYCVPGMILTAVALLKANPAPTRAQIVEFMNGNICRCCNYPNIIRAVERAAGARQGVA